MVPAQPTVWRGHMDIPDVVSCVALAYTLNIVALSCRLTRYYVWVCVCVVSGECVPRG